MTEFLQNNKEKRVQRIHFILRRYLIKLFLKKQQYDSTKQQYNPDHTKQSLMDHQNQEQNLNIFDLIVNYTQNLARVDCFKHLGQALKNYCKCQDCQLPLCLECLKDYVQEHSEFKSLNLIQIQIVQRIHDDAFAQGSDPIKAFQILRNLFLKLILFFENRNEKRFKFEWRILNFDKIQSLIFTVLIIMDIISNKQIVLSAFVLI